MNKQKIKAFTLVELIVVITILSILSTIGFISLQGYSVSSRDSVRISDINNLTKSLELYRLEEGEGYYPDPSSGDVVTFSGGELWTQGSYGEEVFSEVARMGEYPVDPLTSSEYTYSVLNTWQEYQLGAILEGDFVINHSVLNSTNAADKVYKAYIKGDYNGVSAHVSTGTITYILAVPSIITTDLNFKDYETIVSDKKLVFSGKKNIPYSYKGNDISMEADNSVSMVNESNYIIGKPKKNEIKDLSQEDKELIGVNAKLAYSNTILSGNPKIDNILSKDTTDKEIAGLLGVFVINLGLGISQSDKSSLTYVPTPSCDPKGSISLVNSTFVDGVISEDETNLSWQKTDSSSVCYYSCNSGWTGTNCDEEMGWKDEDPNCNLPDVKITVAGGIIQTWAGCNSTLGDNATSYTDGTTYYECHDYKGGETDSDADPDDCKDDFFDYTNTEKEYSSQYNLNPDPTFDNIWGKMYSYDDLSANCLGSSPGANCVCPIGWHIPTKSDFDLMVEKIGNSGNNGWEDHLDYDINTNIVQFLKLPLAGRINDNDGRGRGEKGFLLSSKSGRGLNVIYSDSSIKSFGNLSDDYSHSVRCIKDS